MNSTLDEPPLKKIALTLTGDYAKSWGTWEGIREIIQNWHDGLYETKLDFEVAIHKENNKIVDNKIVFGKVDHTDGSFDVFEANVEFYYPRDPRNIGVDPKIHSRQLLGYLVYGKKELGRLCVINKNISLQKKILLLGYSRKENNAPEVIGQFGEGLKVGALALVREGRNVTMETDTDLWRFDLCHDENFEEKLLTVHVTARSGERDGVPNCSVCQLPDSVQLCNSDTVTTISLEADEWTKEYQRRFLFLCPPKDLVRLELGEIILDRELQGQLFVKGIWVQDMREDDLGTGVNFANLHIDRDRNAVPKPSEIDHLICSMWTKALDVRPDLLPMYYQLLKNDKYRDVRQALVYCDDNIADKISLQFAKENGAKAFPVSNSAPSSQLEKIRRHLDVDVVLVNDLLLKMMHKSGRYKSVDDALKSTEKAPYTSLPISDISADERSLLDHALCLTRYVHPKASIANMEILDYEQPTLKGCTVQDQMIQIPRWLLQTNMEAHTCVISSAKATDIGPPEITQCKCAVVRLMCSLCNALSGVLSGGSAPYDHHLLSIIRHLSARECTAAEAYCFPLHQTSALPHDQTNIKKIEEKERSLHKEIDTLNTQLQQSSKESQRRMDEMSKSLRQAEKDLVVKISANNEETERLRDDYNRKIDRMLQDHKREKEKLIKAHQMERTERIQAEQKKAHLRRCIDKQEKERKDEKEAMSRRQTNMLDELLHYVHQCKQRTQPVVDWLNEQIDSELTDECKKDHLQKFKKLAEELRDQYQAQKFRCMVCQIRRKEFIFIPCGHYGVCDTCVDALPGSKCPNCNEEVTSTTQVFDA